MQVLNKSFCCIVQNILILLVPTFFVNYMSKLTIQNWSYYSYENGSEKEKIADLVLCSMFG